MDRVPLNYVKDKFLVLIEHKIETEGNYSIQSERLAKMSVIPEGVIGNPGFFMTMDPR